MHDLPNTEPAPSVSTTQRSAARKATALALAGFILVVMVIWFGFLGWGAVALIAWLTDVARAGI